MEFLEFKYDPPAGIELEWVYYDAADPSHACRHPMVRPLMVYAENVYT